MLKKIFAPTRYLGLSRILLIAMIISMASCFFMVAFTIMDVFGRHFLKQPIPGVIEFNEVMMIFVVYLGLGLAQREKAHIRAELFVSRLSLKWRGRFEGFSLFLATAFWTILFTQTATKAWNSYLIGEYREGLIKFPIWPARWALAVGVLLMSLQLFRDIYASWASKENEDRTIETP